MINETFDAFPIDLSAFNGPICKQQCFQTFKDGGCVCGGGVFGEGGKGEAISES